MATTIAGDILKIWDTARPELAGAVADDGGTQTDETSEANESTADDMTLLPAAPATGDAYYFGGYGEASAITINVSTAGAGTWSLTWEYHNGTSWAALSNVTDGTSGFQTAGSNDVSFDVPSDWETTSVDGIDAYWVRARVSSFTGITTQPLGQEAEITADRTLVAKTRGTIGFSPNVQMAESGQHASLQQEKAPVSEAWELAFEGVMVSDLGGLEVLGLYDSTAQEVLGTAGEEDLSTPDSIEVEAEDEAGSTIISWLLPDVVLELGDMSIEEDDFSVWTATGHTLQRPRVTNTTA